MSAESGRPRTLLVTGAAGFLGRHVAREAARQGYRVTGIGHGGWTDETWRSWGLSAWNEADVELASLLAHGGEPDVIVHCAGSGSVGFSLQDPRQDFERTVETTADVLEYVRTASPHTVLVYPSSGAVYGCPQRLPVAETDPLDPISPYGVHKRIVEELAISYGRTFGVRVAIVRIFSAYGEGLRKQLLWDACRKALAGEPRFGGTGAETRDWIHVEDVASLLMLASAHAAAGGFVVNGTCGQEVAVGEILRVLFDELGVASRPTFTGELRPGDPPRVAGDPARALGLGWRPARDWAEGVRAYARWFGSGSR